MASIKEGEPVMNGTKDHECSSRGRREDKWIFKRRRSSHGPRPVTKFGPKAQLVDDHSVENDLNLTCDPSNMILGWKSHPKHVLVIRKPDDSDVSFCFRELAYWLVKDKNLVLHVEPSSLDRPEIIKDKNMEAIWGNIRTWSQGETSPNAIDFIITLGGDGTLLYAASLFQSNCPPVISYHVGSLGFLTSFKFSNYKQDLTTIIAGKGKLVLRKRLDCVFMSSKKIEDSNKNKEEKKCYTVLNELVIDRGSASYLSNLDVYCNDHLITVIQGDGLIVSTPTGSTAYAAAAGGSMVHPSVPGILLTPVCAHSLSSRPVIVPAGVELKIILSNDSRSGAFASFDGRNRQELHSGEGICVTTSIYPVPCLTKEDQINDWFTSLGECLHWNIRERQKPL